MTAFASLSDAELVSLMDDANVNHDDVQYDACYVELVRRDALPLEDRDDFECWDDDADLESYSLECAFGPEE
jgi:hypothetical protein